MTYRNKSSTGDRVIDRLLSECASAGSQRAWAQQHGFSPQFVTDILHGRREVTERLAAALGFEKVFLWSDKRREDE